MRAIILKRIAWIKILTVCLFCGLFVRLFWLQVVTKDLLVRKGALGSILEESIEAPRGEIFDREGRILVGNKPRFALSIWPVKGSRGGMTIVLRRLRQVLNLNRREFRLLLDRARSNPYRPLYLTGPFTKDELAKAVELSELFPQLKLTVRFVRDYPHAGLAAHVLGYLGEVDKELLGRSNLYEPGDLVGKDGVEMFWDRVLRGRKGRRLVLLNAQGRIVRVLEERPPAMGKDIKLTIDLRLQLKAEAAIDEAIRSLSKVGIEGVDAGAVVLDVNTGEVLAMVSRPGYNPAWFLNVAHTDEVKALLIDPHSPLLNRTVAGLYSPASTFKIITATAALEEGVATQDSVFYCSGKYEIGNRVFHCFVRSGHGRIGFINALAYSCDVVFYRLGVALGESKLTKWAQAFGIGRDTGIDLPGELKGVLPNAEFKLKYCHEPWYAGDDANLAIGQGYLMVTPLQMAVVIAAVANGGTIYRPHVLLSVGSKASNTPEVIRRLQISASTRSVLARGLRGAVQYGTARSVHSDISIAGKTGTVENSPSQGNPEGRNHTWFACYAPYERPKIAVVVVLERSGGYGGQKAASVAASIVSSWWRLESKNR